MKAHLLATILVVSFFTTSTPQASPLGPNQEKGAPQIIKYNPVYNSTYNSNSGNNSVTEKTIQTPVFTTDKSVVQGIIREGKAEKVIEARQGDTLSTVAADTYAAPGNDIYTTKIYGKVSFLDSNHQVVAEENVSEMECTQQMEKTSPGTPLSFLDTSHASPTWKVKSSQDATDTTRNGEPGKNLTEKLIEAPIAVFKTPTRCEDDPNSPCVFYYYYAYTSITSHYPLPPTKLIHAYCTLQDPKNP